MIHLAQWISPDLLRPLGLALLHFLWQGAALAALAALALTLARTASMRYVLGVIILAAMVAAPAITFLIVSRSAAATHGKFPPRRTLARRARQAPLRFWPMRMQRSRSPLPKSPTSFWSRPGFSASCCLACARPVASLLSSASAVAIPRLCMLHSSNVAWPCNAAWASRVSSSIASLSNWMPHR